MSERGKVISKLECALKFRRKIDYYFINVDMKLKFLVKSYHWYCGNLTIFEFDLKKNQNISNFSIFL